MGATRADLVANDSGGGVKLFMTSGQGVNGQNDVNAALLESFGNTGVIKNGSYTLTMHLVDKASKDSADLTFSGVLNGATDLSLQNQFTQPLTGTATLGGNNYGVVIGLYSAPGEPGSGIKGLIGTNVMVVPPSLPVKTAAEFIAHGAYVRAVGHDPRTGVPTSVSGIVDQATVRVERLP